MNMNGIRKEKEKITNKNLKEGREKNKKQKKTKNNEYNFKRKKRFFVNIKETTNEGKIKKEKNDVEKRKKGKISRKKKENI